VVASLSRPAVTGRDAIAEQAEPGHRQDGGVPTRILFVCSGNICRSPTAEAVMLQLVEQAGLADEIDVDGAGTGAWHVGEAPDERATRAAAQRGITLRGVARQIDPTDFEQFDLILAVDDENLNRLRRIAPVGSAVRVRKLDRDDVPDPYYGGPAGFDAVLDQVIEACQRWLDELHDDVRQG
jgi:protein-tyrosine phosphatase